MRTCQMINQAGKPIPQQCEDCRFLPNCISYNCLKEDFCKSKVPKDDPDLRYEIRME